MQTVRIFVGSVSSDTKNAVLSNLAKSGQASGLDCNIVAEKRYVPCDVAVVWGQPKVTRRSGTKASGEHLFRSEVFARHAGPVVIIDAPLLGRKVPMYRRRHWLFRKLVPRHALAHRLFPSWQSAKEDFSEFRVGVGGALGDNGGLALAPFAHGRYRLLEQRLDLPPLKSYRKTGKNVIVIGQVPGDASLRGLDVNQWIVKTSSRLLQLTDRSICVRPHPGAGASNPKLMEALKGMGVMIEDASRPLGTSLEDAWAVVTCCSGAAIDALMAGVPAIASSSASFAWDVTDHNLEQVVAPTEFPREQWLDRLAAAQWSRAEIDSGAIWPPLLMACDAARLSRTAA